MFRLHQLLTANAGRSVKPPPSIAGKPWTMPKSGSEPNNANCKNVCRDHAIHESEGQRRGLKYKGADGTLVPNQGEVHVQHREKDCKTYSFTFQHAEAHCPIMSVTQLATRDCTVTFHKLGGHVMYPIGENMFVAKDCVFFVMLDILHPDVHRRVSQ